MPVLIIAEAGVNHNGDINIAKQLIDAATEAGVDYVKFQSFNAEALVSAAAKKAGYQTVNTGEGEESQLAMLKKLELDEATHILLMDYCRLKGVKFLSTAFDPESIELLIKLDIDLFKIPSGEITNEPYLRRIGGLGKPIIVSTGMCDTRDILNALVVLKDAGARRRDVILLHCNTEYPTPMRDVNLRAMQSMAKDFDLPVGYSDHTLGIEVPIAAVAMGAVCIEKHFTLDRNMPGPDHKASLEPDELKAMVKAIRNIELALGDGIKEPSESEKKNISVARKSIHLAQDLARGHIIEEKDLVMKRPGTGISPMNWREVAGKKLTRDLPAETLLSRNDIE